MATYQVPAPAQMSLKGDMIENFKTFKSQWEFYLLATELDKKMLNEDGTANNAGKTQVAATLCSVIGPGCLKILNSIAGVTDADKRDPEIILQKLETHFIPQRHVLFERFKFFSAVQAENETIDNLGVRLRQLSARASELSKTHKEQMRSTQENTNHEVHGTQRIQKPKKTKFNFKQKKFTENKSASSPQETNDEWRNTPDINGFSPVQKLMSRRTKTTMPVANILLQPTVVQDVPEMVKIKRQKAKLNYDRYTKPLPELEIGEPVRLQPFKPKQPWSSGSCVGKVGPRSYL
ncbi:hypothetical protein LOTGIDRAFT_176712, partial [Lottia gigantea]